MDTMLYKPNLAETVQRMTAWWNWQPVDRCILTITSVRDDAGDLKPPPRPATVHERWTSLEYLDACNEYDHRRIFYGAEAIPIWNPGFPGHVSIPTFYGGKLTLDWDTGWQGEILDGEKLDVSGLRIDRTNPWWIWGDVMLNHAREVSAGKSIPAMSAIGGCGDTLSRLRGTERLMYDMMDDPASVLAAELKLMEDWVGVFDNQYEILTRDGGPMTTWFGLWAPGRFYPTQCDFSYGISADCFRECFVPALRRQMDFLDNTVYHCDGIEAFHHVDELAKIEKIRAIQILPGDGKPSPLHFLDVLKKVQRLGKGLHITIPPEEVEQALDLLSSRGLCINTWASSETRARELIDLAGRKSVDRG